MFARTAPLRRELERALPSRPFTVRFWDGSELAATDGAADPLTFTATSPDAIRRALLAPGQLGIGRAYVAGDLMPDDLDAAMRLLTTWQPPALDTKTKARLAGAAVQAAGVGRPPARPASELVPQGKRHSRERDERAVRWHYDVGNRFFALFLDEAMTYSCAYWRGGEDETLEEAQVAKVDLVARKLQLAEGKTVLDVGCGWGAFGIHAAKTYGAKVTGITLSQPQADEANRRAAEAGVADLTEFRVQDYRDLGGQRYDAISSIGMVEHVGHVRIDEYARTLAALLTPQGRLLNHGIARLRHGDPEAGPFSERYVFPDAAPLHLSRIALAMERAGLVTRHVEELTGDYQRTLQHWVDRLDANHDEGVRLAGEDRMRVWRLYLRAARNGFRTGFLSTYQVLVSPARADAAL